MRRPEPTAIDPATVARFWEKSIPEPNTGCWLWTAATDKDGYGKFQITNQAAGPKQFRGRAHMLSLALKLGRWPIAALHGCDVRWCVNPDHLREGTQKENRADAVSRGREPRGAAKPFAKLTDEVIAAARARRARGACLTAMATEYGVSLSSLAAAVSGRTWRHVE